MPSAAPTAPTDTTRRHFLGRGSGVSLGAIAWHELAIRSGRADATPAPTNERHFFLVSVFPFSGRVKKEKKHLPFYPSGSRSTAQPMASSRY